MLSNDSNVRLKLMLFHLQAFLMVAFILAGAILTQKISGWFLIFLPLLVPFFYWSILRKMRNVAVNVFISGEELFYHQNHKNYSISKMHIESVCDSGLFSGNQEIYIKLKSGEEIVFFSKNDCGSFYKRRVLNEINTWLNRSNEGLVLKKGMPGSKK